MNTIGKLFSRIATTTTMVLLALVIALPLNASVLAAAAFIPDDFNRCTPDSFWTVENPGNLPAPVITGQYTGESALQFTIPAGTVATFSNTNKNAPRLMQPATDTDFELEVKFNTALGLQTGNNWRIQGLLFRDDTTNSWLRFDLNTNATNINYYIGYIDSAGVLHDVRGPAVIGPTNANSAPVILRVRYEQALNRWRVGYQLGTQDYGYRQPFLETDPFEGLPTGFTFTVTDVGVFAGTTGTSTPEFVSQVDYIKSIPDAFTDDAFTINVTKNGSGEVNWPMTNVSQQCTGNQVTLTATPEDGSTFDGWSGDVTNAAATIQLVMNRSYNLIATFTGGDPVDQPFDFYFPFIRR